MINRQWLKKTYKNVAYKTLIGHISNPCG